MHGDPVAGDWLPDLCRLPALFAVMVVAEMVVLVLALAPLSSGEWDAGRFAAASLFSQWLALTSAVLLCTSRRLLLRLGRVAGSLVAFLIPVLVAALGAVLVHEIDIGLGYGLTVPPGQRWAFVGGCAAVAAVIGGAALRYFYVQQQWRRQVQAQARAEVQALQARIRPHFLFNSMNSIASLVRSDPVTAEKAIVDLSDLFRAALGAGESGSDLRGEVELAERYLAIEKLRLGPRLRVEWQRDEPLPWDLPLPRLLLQPLVENAVLHGIARLPDGGTVRISLAAGAGMLRVAVDNPAPPPRAGDEAQHGARHAQRSIGDRLAHAIGPKARLTASHADGYYRCELLIPWPR